MGIKVVGLIVLEFAIVNRHNMRGEAEAVVGLQQWRYIQAVLRKTCRGRAIRGVETLGMEFLDWMGVA